MQGIIDLINAEGIHLLSSPKVFFFCLVGSTGVVLTGLDEVMRCWLIIESTGQGRAVNVMSRGYRWRITMIGLNMSIVRSPRN